MSQEFQTFSHKSPSAFSGRFTQFNRFLEDRQLALLKEGDEHRAELDTIEKVQAHAAAMKQEFMERLGDIPMRDCPLDARVEFVRDMGAYTIENVIFQARRDVYVTASLYLPKGLTEPSAAVLYLCGHTDSGRMSDRYQEVPQTMANAGLIVFAVDPTGQGERKNFYNPETGEYAIENAVPDHDCCGVPSTATGRFLAAYFVADQFAAVDYMLTRPEIDPARIGVTGCSGGGLQSLAVMTCDDRVAAAAPATFTSTRREILFTCQSQDSEQIWPGCAAYGFDHFEPFYIFAPKPVLFLTVSSDFFPIEGAYEVYDEARRIYGMYGKEDNVRFFEDPACHGYTQPLAEAAADFFCDVFGVENRPHTPRCPLPMNEIQSTKTGNVKGDFTQARTIPDETAMLAEQLRAKRDGVGVREWLWEKVNYGRIPSPPVLRIDDDKNLTRIGEYVGRSVMWWVQKRLCAYGVLIGKDAVETSSPTVIALWDNGTHAIVEHEDWIKAQCDGGKQVLVVDLPGVGNIRQAHIWGWSGYHDAYGTFYKMCCDLLYMDDSMAAMQTYHTLRTADMLKESMRVENLSFFCDGQEGVYGIMAGYLAGIPREYGDGLLRNVEGQILSQRPLRYSNTLAYLIPGMLRYFDYDELM